MFRFVFGAFPTPPSPDILIIAEVDLLLVACYATLLLFPSSGRSRSNNTSLIWITS